MRRLSHQNDINIMQDTFHQAGKQVDLCLVVLAQAAESEADQVHSASTR